LKRRVLTIALAVLLAALGTGGVLAYVHQADARAIAGMKPVSVLVAQQQIASGTSAGDALREGMLVRETLPASSVPVDAVGSITPQLAALVTSTLIQPGQLLLRPVLVTAAQVTGGLAIPKGMVAVTIQLCMPEAVAGNITAGAQVAVFDTFAPGASRSLLAQPNCAGPHQQQDFSSAHTRVVLPKVEVLSVGAAGAPGQNGTSSTSSSATTSSSTSSPASGQANMMVTLAVNQADAERLILLTETGLPYLALLTHSSQTSLDSTLVPLLQP
jgi:pilus assembly protein CpaB